MPGHAPDRPNQVEIRIRNTGAIGVKALVDYIIRAKIDLDPNGNSDIAPLLKWLNAVYREDPAARWVTSGRSGAYFDRTSKTSKLLPSTHNVLEAIRGVYQSVQIRFGLLTINVDTATSAFWVPDLNIIDMIRALGGVAPQWNLEAWFLENPNNFFSACSRLVGLYFNVRHLKAGANQRKVRLSKWSRKNARETQFEMMDRATGQAVVTNVADYFLNTYAIKLQYPNLPLADTRAGQFPLELCFSAHGERFKEVLDGAETADFIGFATASAYVRHQQISENVKKLAWHTLEKPEDMGLSVETEMMTIDARILPTPNPRYGPSTGPIAPAMGRWNLRGRRLLQPCSIASWGTIYFPARQALDDGAIGRFGEAIGMAFSQLGMSVPQAAPSFVKGNPQGDVRLMIADLLSKADAQFLQKPQILFFLLHSGADRLYGAIKNACDVQFGVASQVMLVEKAMKQRGQTQYLANVGLKVNVKLGGANHRIDEPFFRKGCMILGGDTSHPSPAQLRLNPLPPSFSALTATWDGACVAYTAVASAQDGKEQLILDFQEMVKELIRRYSAKNGGKLPESIIYYRDGLSESQFGQILAAEAKPLKNACAQLGGAPPRITIVVCVKRHHTRLFPTGQGDKNGNVLPGTVVENSTANDIYLVAHPGLQGTNRPTRYAVILDENKLSANDFQRMTNNLCWTYSRATSAVSIVPPVYYAHQACERARLHVRDSPDGGQILGEVKDSLRYTMYWQ
ncbi:MAG: hypothetical protein M1838_005079 [Thelocarpon superellum]|nr:MAG: hypothetical protein M1838_005079 [Thelocarpon superellum]